MMLLKALCVSLGMCMVSPAIAQPAQPFNFPIVHALKAKVAAANTTTPASASDTAGVLGALVNVQAKVIADITEANTLASTPMTNGLVWDPIGAACYPTLITFIQGLPSPANLPVPPTGAGGGLVTAQEQARLVAIAAKQAISNISLVGYPTSLKLACDPLILDDVALKGEVISGAAGINLLIAGFLPKL